MLGPEIDDGSIVYLIAKPVPRHVIALSKYAVAWLATMALGALPLLVAGLVLDASHPGHAVGWGVAGAVSGTAYTALFLGLAALTRHAVVVGLLFVLLWEGLLGGLLPGIRWLDVGAWGTQVGASVSDALDAPRHRTGVRPGRRRAWSRGRRCGSPATGCVRSRCAATNRASTPSQGRGPAPGWQDGPHGGSRRRRATSSPSPRGCT